MPETMNLYNDIDPFSCQHLRNLIDAGLIPPGDVYECSITDLTPEICSQYTQCHFFAGIAGWPLALQIAGWPADAPVWTGSPPCQPFSVAGQQIGFDDPRHLAPAFLDLIAECRPEFVFGEQVAAAISQHWLDFIFADLEAENYTCGASVLAACSVGAPHLRSRIMFGAVAHDYRAQCRGERIHGSEKGTDEKGGRAAIEFTGCGNTGSVGNGHNEGLEIRSGRPEQIDGETGREDAQQPVGLPGIPGAVPDTTGTRSMPTTTTPAKSGKPEPQSQGVIPGGSSGYTLPVSQPATTMGNWIDVEWVYCLDGCYRPIKPGVEPLAYGLSARMGSMQPALRRLVSSNRKGRLKGYGNAIVPQVAAAFVVEFLESVKIIKNNYCTAK